MGSMGEMSNNIFEFYDMIHWTLEEIDDCVSYEPAQSTEIYKPLKEIKICYSSEKVTYKMIVRFKRGIVYKKYGIIIGNRGVVYIKRFNKADYNSIDI